MIMKRKIFLFVILQFISLFILSSCCNIKGLVEPEEQDVKKKLEFINSLLEHPEQMNQIIKNSKYQYTFNESSNKDYKLLNEYAEDFQHGYKIVKNRIIKGVYYYDDDYHSYSLDHDLAIESNSNSEKLLNFQFIKYGRTWKLNTITKWLWMQYEPRCNMFGF